VEQMAAVIGGESVDDGGFSMAIDGRLLPIFR
jgi:hypothetical protein